MNAITSASHKEPWDSATEEFWLHNIDRFIQGMQFYTPQLLAQAHILSGSHILEIGCAGGDLAIQLAPQAASLMALDKSSLVIDYAQNTNSHIAITYIAADAQTYQFPQNFFDRMISKNGVQFFSDSTLAWKNIYSALAPGAQATIQVWDLLEKNPWFYFPAELFSPEKLNVTPAPFSMSNPNTIIPLLESTGFIEVRAIPVHAPHWLGKDIADAYTFLLQRYPHAHEAEYQAARIKLEKWLAQYMTPQGILCDSAAIIYQFQKPD